MKLLIAAIYTNYTSHVVDDDDVDDLNDDKSRGMFSPRNAAR